MEKVSIIIGKTVQKVSKIRGGGSALPGLIVEKTDPKFVGKVLKKLPLGVAVISGTNGKTTTTKIVAELLRKQNLKVFTNNTGSNFVRGVISAILQDIHLNGKFDYDIAILELDEAHAVKFCEVVDIDYALLLNVQRDQLDRFGEIDHTADLLQKVASKAKKAVILNREDPRVGKIKADKAYYFGLSDALINEFPSDDDLIVKSKTKASTKQALITLDKLKGQNATYKIGNNEYNCKLKLKGIYNAFNAAGALTLCNLIMPDSKAQAFIDDLADVTSAFGRGESFTINDAEVEILLVKNPSAFQLSIESFADRDHDYMIAINDNVADGHDVSWLWNVNFQKLPKVEIVSGIRASDMALRLKYDDFDTEQLEIEPDLEAALRSFLYANNRPKRIFTTYTAMLEIRKIISGKSLV